MKNIRGTQKASAPKKQTNDLGPISLLPLNLKIPGDLRGELDYITRYEGATSVSELVRDWIREKAVLYKKDKTYLVFKERLQPKKQETIG